MKVFTGPRGGRYVIKNNKKVYIKEKNISFYSTKERTFNSQEDRNMPKAGISCKRRYCCCCGKELNKSECDYYDLTDYCPKCALSDGIISSLE